MSDLVLRGGTVVDGTGGPRQVADVVISGGRIAALLRPGARASGRAVDVSGLVVAPGFIDLHAHSDLAVLEAPHLAKTLQGVTLEVCGQDGLSYAPASEATAARMVAQLAGWNGVPARVPRWPRVADYLREVDRGAAVNVAYLVPHGTVRFEVLGDADRPASGPELHRLCGLVAQGLEDGAVGLSTGLTYVPGCYADDDELLALSRVVRGYGGFHATHHRNYGRHVVAAYTEAVDLAQRAGVALHLAHCHVNFAVNRGRAGEVLARVDRANAAGGDVTLDSYPYRAGATYLHALLPSWVQAGTAQQVAARLTDPGIRRRVIETLEVEGSDGHHGMPVEWDTIVLSGVVDPGLQAWAGRSFAALAREQRLPPAELYLDVVVRDQLRSSCLVDVGDEDHVRQIMQHPVHTVGTDGILVGTRPHPRGWGTYPRLLGHYVRELGLLSLEAAVARMTGRAARRLGLRDRGRVTAGAWADLVVFDPDTVASLATTEEPRRGPVGIPHVLVNGCFTVRDGSRTEALPGRAVRRAVAA